MKSFSKLVAVIAMITFLATGCQKWKPEPRIETTVVTKTSVDDTTAVTTSQKDLKDDPILHGSGSNYIDEAIARGQLANNVGAVPVTLWINSDGKTGVDGALWGIPGTFNCPKPTSAQLPSAKEDSIYKMVVEDYSPFQINIVTTASAYAQAQGLKMELVLTNKTPQMQASTILGNVPGAAYVNSILWQNGTVCFSFVSEFTGPDKYKKIAESVTHELGHTFGLFHQKEPNTNFEYRFPSDDLLYGANMGNGYQARFTRFIIGPSNSLPAGQMQDDAAVIASIAGYKDEFNSGSLSTSNPALSSTSITAVLVHSDNAHAFYKNTTGTKTVTVTSNGNLKPKILVYSSLTDTNPVPYPSNDYGKISVQITGKKWIKVCAEQPSNYTGSPVAGGYSIKTN